ncbi:Spy/CpxP family protein refolding chaperone [Phenylobacterium sp.]|uniref:Spy/CpxP family protein refolding chaperone n=1 Tax=Phenylobacterium sp. TaxID=1871053 RepID=UPI0025DFDA04|nr:Spy/CpxP family protein refolding chaperone [Phenylobacterium sp.]
MKPRLFAAVAPALALAAAAHAQPAMPDQHAAHGPPGAMMGEMKAHAEAMQKQHLDDLRTILRIRPDQESALAAFVDAHKPMMREFKAPPEGQPLTTPQRLEQMAKHDAEMTAQHERMRQALSKFYAALSPDQQKVFDALQRMHGPPPGPMGPDMMMMHGGPSGGRQMMIMRHDGHEPPR